MPDTEVLIVGAGPVGLTLAVDLGKRGIRCILIEQKDAPQFLPKMERCNARTMEIYRRLGISERIRDAGFPRQCPMDVFIVLSLVEPPLLHLPYPSVAEAKASIKACNDGTQPLEPYQLISQYTLEPLLKSVAEAIPNVSVRYGCELISFSQDAGVGDRTGSQRRTARPRKSPQVILSAATAAPAMCEGSSASSCKAMPISCNSGRRSIAATSCSTKSRSARAVTIMSPIRRRPF